MGNERTLEQLAGSWSVACSGVWCRRAIGAARLEGMQIAERVMMRAASMGETCKQKKKKESKENRL